MASISVVIPCYRCSATITRAVESVVVQTLRPMEIILVDDASNDDTLKTLQFLQEKWGVDWIKIITLSENQGPASARDAGWDRAQGEYIAFLDADDSWHPKKLETQYRFMQSQPTIVVSSHGYCLPDEKPRHAYDLTYPKVKNVSKALLMLTNKFVKPSTVMLRRMIPQRFLKGRRYMEDQLLWFEIVSEGGKICYLDVPLTYSYKAPFGVEGLSSQLLQMEKAELQNYWWLQKQQKLNFFFAVLLSIFSLLKYVRRLVIVHFVSPDKNISRITFLHYVFPAAFLINSLSTTALLIGLGLLGKSHMAADIGLVQGATLATFYAFSANARSIILNLSDRIPLSVVLLSRLILIMPLGVMAFVLSVYATEIEAAFALAIILRRCVEWINEVHLSESELKTGTRFSLFFLLLQTFLLLVALVSCLNQSPYYLVGLYVWALLPLTFSLAFVFKQILNSPLGKTIKTLPVLLPHFGSTAIIGISIYVFRLLILLLTGKEIAGDLFTAFAIGSFMGSTFANVLGPTLLLHESRSGMSYFPKFIKIILSGMMLVGLIVFTASWIKLDLLLNSGKSFLFFEAMGLSLIGGVIMVLAQRIRLNLLQSNQGVDVFGPDMLIHILLVASVPFLFYSGGMHAFILLYFVNALASYIFYASAERTFINQVGFSFLSKQTITSVIAFLILLPLFLQLSGTLYRSPYPYVDSGGILQALPLPLSVVICFAAIPFFGQYQRARLSLTIIFLLFALMVFTSIVATQGAISQEKRKLILLVQFILPTFALVLGQTFENRDVNKFSLEKAWLYVLISIIPIQLIFTGIRGDYVLSHYLYLFSIYQHLQFVPMVFVCAFLLIYFSLWQLTEYRKLLICMVPLLAIYAILSYSMLALSTLITGVIGITLYRHNKQRNKYLLRIVILLLVTTGGYLTLSSQSYLFNEKFGLATLSNKYDSSQSSTIVLFKNIHQRLQDWKFYSDRILSNRDTILFGHSQPPERTVTTSAHNYYLDFIYNFGVIALLPILFLTGYTLVKIYQHRQNIATDQQVLGLTVVVIMLAVVDNFFKVTLRQPYPGIVAFFLWGMLLTRLHSYDQQGKLESTAPTNPNYAPEAVEEI